MRHATLMVALTLLTVGIPAVVLADGGDDQPNVAEKGNMTIDDDVRIQPGWWEDHGISYNLGDTDPSVDEEPRWFWIEWMNEDATVYVNTTGPVIAGVDIFEASTEEGGTYTPACPQDLVYDIYPEEDENKLSYLFRLSQHGPENERIVPEHQEGGELAGSFETELDKLDDPDKRYVMAIYPQVSLNQTQALDDFGSPTIEWAVTGDVSAEPMDAEADLPVEVDEWVSTEIGENFECPAKEPQFPPGVIPWPGSSSQQQSSLIADDLLAASLPDAPSVDEALSLDSFTRTQAETCTPTGDGDQDTEEGFIQVANPAGETATVTEVANMFLLPSIDGGVEGVDGPPLSDHTQGFDAHIWDLGCETPSSENKLCIYEDDPPEISLQVFIPGDVTVFGLKFYGEDLADHKGNDVLEPGECLKDDEVPKGVQNIVVYLPEGYPDGAYASVGPGDSFLQEDPPAGLYSSAFCLEYGEFSGTDKERCEEAT